MKRILTLLLISLFTLHLTGCSEDEDQTTLTINVENPSSLSSNTIGIDSFIPISDILYYDSATRIVYILNDTYGSWSFVYTPYYAPNGLPYRYNPETNTLEEIHQELLH